MNGPDIIARSISALEIPDEFNNTWQYHSQSDRHSKITCWSIMFDLLNNCPLVRKHVADGKVGFGINLTLRDFQTRRKKNLDLVIAEPAAGEKLERRPGKHIKRRIETFADVAEEYEVLLSGAEKKQLDLLPVLPLVPVGNVCVALETKAVMTAHIKALPRLHDELDSSHLTVHGHADHAVAAALVVVNFGKSFISPKRNAFDLARRDPVINQHNQPNDTLRTIEKVVEIRRRNRPSEQGFDAMGVILIDFKNDGSPFRIVTKSPAPQPGDPIHYSAMVQRICSQYHAKFQGL
jgi:hypothetical protein